MTCIAFKLNDGLYAATALIAKAELSCHDLGCVFGGMPCVFLSAAAALHSTSSTLPLSAKLASCQLLASLMPSQEKANAAPEGWAGICWDDYHMTTDPNGYAAQRCFVPSRQHEIISQHF